ARRARGAGRPLLRNPGRPRRREANRLRARGARRAERPGGSRAALREREHGVRAPPGRSPEIRTSARPPPGPRARRDRLMSDLSSEARALVGAARAEPGLSAEEKARVRARMLATAGAGALALSGGSAKAAGTKLALSLKGWIMGGASLVL